VIRYLVIGSFLFLIAGVAVTIGIPAYETAAITEGSPYTPQQLKGRSVYIREGCMYCHTQQVRAIEAGFGTVHSRGDIGPESRPEDYAGQQPVLWGTNRQGPDLSHTAGRPPGNSPLWQLQHLVDPRLSDPGSLMPSFRHLPREELDALVDYLMTLQ
jgi:cytochrome c oxidase cbb3-type subunit II